MRFLRKVALILLAFPVRTVRTPRLSILLYHSISDEPWQYAVSTGNFKAQMEYISSHADVIPLARAIEHIQGKPLARDAIAVTFDDGYRDFLDNALPALTEFNIPATVFLSLREVDPRDLGSDRALLDEGDASALAHPLVELGSHALTHRKLTSLSAEALEHELTRSRELIQERFNRTPRYLAYPRGSYSQSVAAAVEEADYAAGFTTEPRAANVGENLFTLPRIEVQWDTSMPEFRARLTHAADWYYMLRSWL